MNAPPALAIHRLCSRAPAREPVIARLALATLASDVAESLAWQPALPPQSVLLLRRMQLSLPGFKLERMPDGGVRAEAGRIARSQLADACAHAVRPAYETASDLATAVLFGDDAELLACLARDALAGCLDRWWWRALLGRDYPDWPAAWHAKPEANPGALRLLARAGLDAAVCAALESTERCGDSPEQARHPARSIPTTPNAANTPATPPTPSGPTRLPLAAASDHAQRPPLAASPDTANHAAPAAQRVSRGVLQSVLQSVSQSRSQAVSQCVPLPASVPASAPTLCTSATPRTSAAANPPPAGRRAERAWADSWPESGDRRTRGTETTVDPRTDPRGDRTAQDSGGVLATAGGSAAHPWRDAARRPAQPADVQQAATSFPRIPTATSMAPLPRTARLIDDAARPDPVPPAAAARQADPPGAADSAERTPRATDVARIAHPARRDVAAPAATAPEQTPAPLGARPQVVVSRHARLLFLVNMLLGDGLYPDFTRPADPGFPLPIWQLLALLGDSLLGPSFRDDPLRPWLERLDADRHAPPERRLPADEPAFDRRWPLPSAPASLEAKANRPWRLRRESTGGFARWYAGYSRSLRTRLAQALGVPPALVGRALVQTDGQALLWASEASIVVVHRLDLHPVRWRLAGLDRDPGYLPSVGRTLRFVFE